MYNFKANPLVSVKETVATDAMFDGFRKCVRNQVNRCIVMVEGQPYIVTAELSLTVGEFVVSIYDDEGRFYASARFDEFDK